MHLTRGQSEQGGLMLSILCSLHIEGLGSGMQNLLACSTACSLLSTCGWRMPLQPNSHIPDCRCTPKASGAMHTL